MTKLAKETPMSLCQAGIARADITPPVGIYHRMWGAATHEQATGVHRPLTATVLLLQAEHDPKQTQAIFSVDHCLLWAPEMAETLDAVSRSTGLAPEQLTFSFSHTHSSGLMGRERVSLPGGDMIPRYLDELSRKLSDLVREATKNLEPVTITFGQGRCDMAAQRDYWDEQTKQFVCGYNPDAFADDTVLVARVSARTGKTLATLVNYACHPTTLAWANTLISPDFVGAMREVVERETEAPCLFFQGASGDLGPREGFVGDVRVADRNGRQLGHAALSALVSLPAPGTRFVYTGPVISGATLGAWEHQPLSAPELKEKSHWQLRRLEVPLPYRAELPNRDQTEKDLHHWRAEEDKAHQRGDTLAARDAHAMVERMTRWLTRIAHLPAGSHFPLPATILRLGDAVVIGVEGEHYQYLQTQLRAKFPDTPLVIFTLANGSRCTYLPTADTYGKGIYQESIAVLAPGTLETLVEVLAEEIRKIVA